MTQAVVHSVGVLAAQAYHATQRPVKPLAAQVSSLSAIWAHHETRLRQVLGPVNVMRLGVQGRSHYTSALVQGVRTGLTRIDGLAFVVTTDHELALVPRPGSSAALVIIMSLADIGRVLDGAQGRDYEWPGDV